MNYNWLTHWENNDLPFHLLNVNPNLEQYWPTLKINTTAKVFVPLCGKTLDLLWLAERGHEVIGVELSDIACRDFFIENKLAFKQEKTLHFTCYYSDRIKLYCGDFFQLTAEHLASVAAVYDRASLIALPSDLRQCYAQHLTQLISPQCEILLIAYETPDTVQGPPYPVSLEDIKSLFNGWQIQPLTRLSRKQLSPFLLNRGYKELYECVYKILKKQ